MTPWKPFYYLACPYTCTEPGASRERKKEVVDERIRQFALAASRMSMAGMLVCSPLLNELLLQHSELPATWEFWRDYAEQQLMRSDALVVLKLDGWAESEGTQGEIKFAESHLMPVLYLDGPLVDLGHLALTPHQCVAGQEMRANQMLARSVEFAMRQLRNISGAEGSVARGVRIEAARAADAIDVVTAPYAALLRTKAERTAAGFQTLDLDGAVATYDAAARTMGLLGDGPDRIIPL